MQWRIQAVAICFVLLSLQCAGQTQALLRSLTTIGACRCRPSEACWPSLNEWQELNNTIHGRLAQVRPIGYVCHEPTYDKAACEHVKNMSSSGVWRAGEPGALQDYGWEVSLPRNETCYIEEGSGAAPRPCHQGRVSLYSALICTTEDVQAAVRFANKRNLRLVVKNTGHDAAGRSSAVDSFQISTHGLNAIQFTDNFVSRRDGAEYHVKAEGPAVTIGAGVLGHDLYAAAAKHGYTVVAGECGTVGVAGGFVQGGGVSTALAPMRGLSADLVLQFEVVTANGTAVVANEYQNEDLFWALRGGGGGTFGVVTSVTMRVFEDFPTVVSDLFFEMTDRDETYWAAGKEVVYKARELSVNGSSAQYYFGRMPTGNPYVKLTMFSHHEKDKQVVEKAFAPLITSLKDKAITPNFKVTAYPKLSSYLAIPQGLYFGGVGYHQENVLIPNDLYTAPDGPERIIDRLATIELHPNDVWVVNTLGGQVNRNTNVDNALHEGWRDAAILLVGNRLFGPSLREQEAVQERISKVEGPVLQSLQPSPVAMYLNEADPHLENSQDWFWGEKYGRLRDIKRKWDPEGLFIVPLGVGSEEWDGDGMCRVGHFRGLVDFFNMLL
ncbi:FAD-binding domain-containing protein [Aspergillus varians]